MDGEADTQDQSVWLLRKLKSIAELTEEEERAVLDLPLDIRNVPADQDIVREGDRPSACCLILSGFVCRYKTLSQGQRQILSFHIPGDIPDLQSLYLSVMDHSMGTLVPTRLAFIAHPALHALIRNNHNISTAFWRDSLIDAGIFREWMVGLGRRTAHQRLARLFCEMDRRYAAVGLSERHSFELPLTQTELGDAAGLSTVHVNRVLQDLRREGLITFQASRLTIDDPVRLAELAEFDPTYLHVRHDQPA